MFPDTTAVQSLMAWLFIATGCTILYVFPRYFRPVAKRMAEAIWHATHRH